MTTYSAEERSLEERDFEDEIFAALRARTCDQLHDLRVSRAAINEALRRRRIADSRSRIQPKGD